MGVCFFDCLLNMIRVLKFFSTVFNLKVWQALLLYSQSSHNCEDENLIIVFL